MLKTSLIDDHCQTREQQHQFISTPLVKRTGAGGVVQLTATN